MTALAYFHRYQHPLGEAKSGGLIYGLVMVRVAAMFLPFQVTIVTRWPSSWLGPVRAFALVSVKGRDCNTCSACFLSMRS